MSSKVEEQAIIVGRWLKLFWQPLGEQGFKLVQGGLAWGFISNQFDLVVVVSYQQISQFLSICSCSR